MTDVRVIEPASPAVIRVHRALRAHLRGEDLLDCASASVNLLAGVIMQLAQTRAEAHAMAEVVIKDLKEAIDANLRGEGRG